MAKRRDPWTPEEEEHIRTFYPIVGSVWKGWHVLMPERALTPNNICQRAKKLGVTCNHRFQYGKGRAKAQREADAMLADYLLGTGKTVNV